MQDRQITDRRQTDVTIVS